MTRMVACDAVAAAQKLSVASLDVRIAGHCSLGAAQGSSRRGPHATFPPGNGMGKLHAAGCESCLLAALELSSTSYAPSKQTRSAASTAWLASYGLAPGPPVAPYAGQLSFRPQVHQPTPFPPSSFAPTNVNSDANSPARRENPISRPSAANLNRPCIPISTPDFTPPTPQAQWMGPRHVILPSVVVPFTLLATLRRYAGSCLGTFARRKKSFRNVF